MTNIRNWAATALTGLALAFSASAQETSAASVASPSKADTISDSAAVYATFQGDVTDVRNTPFASAGDIEGALNNLGGHNSEKLTKGWIAYSALIASQNPEYRTAVRDIESFYGREVLETGLRNDVRYARTLGGGDDAVAASLTAVRADSKHIDGAASYVKEQAYSLQGSGWAKAKIGDSGALATRLNRAALVGRDARPTMLAAFGSSEIDGVLSQAGSAGAGSLWEDVSGVAGSVKLPAIRTSYAKNRSTITPGKEPIADRIATLAAYRIIGAEDSGAGAIHTAMSERTTSACLKTAHLNLQQCVAAAHQQFEVPFCIGEHALAEVGGCIGDVAQ